VGTFEFQATVAAASREEALAALVVELQGRLGIFFADRKRGDVTRLVITQPATNNLRAGTSTLDAA
jgi:hypothetical protein